MDPRHNTPEWRRFKLLSDAARDVEHAGDLVGSNAPELANALYAAASQLARYARQRYEREANA